MTSWNIVLLHSREPGGSLDYNPIFDLNASELSVIYLPKAD